MSDAATVESAGALMRDLWPNGKVSERIRDASVALRWSYNRTRDLWYGTARRIDGMETARLRAVQAKREKRVGELSYEHDELTARLARMEAMLASLMASVEGRVAHASQPSFCGSGAPVGAGASARNP